MFENLSTRQNIKYFKLAVFIMQIQTIKIAKLNKLLQLSTMIFILLLSFTLEADAQRRDNGRKKDNNTEDYFDESGVGSFRFWYGAGGGLNFGSVNGANLFIVSLSPMVGYKLTPEFSIGPRAELSYIHARSNGGSGVTKQNFFNYGIGVFTRYKLFKQFFAHAEYQIENQGFGGVRQSQNNFFFGGGYTSGGPVGYEIAILWNFLDDETINIPIDYRIAFTYNF